MSGMLGLLIAASARSVLTEQVLPAVVEYLLPLLIPALFLYLRMMIVAKVKDEKVRAVLLRLEDAAARAVKATQQTFVEAIIIAREDGKVTDAEWSAAGAEAKRRALRVLQEELGAAFLADAAKALALPSSDAVLKVAETMVEAAVHDRKLTVAGIADRARDAIVAVVTDALDGPGKGGGKGLPHPNRLGGIRVPSLGRDPLARK